MGHYMSNAFVPGQTVKLKSGGPLITVSAVNDGDVTCEWFDKNGVAMVRVFKAAVQNRRHAVRAQELDGRGRLGATGNLVPPSGAALAAVGQGWRRSRRWRAGVGGGQGGAGGAGGRGD